MKKLAATIILVIVLFFLDILSFSCAEKPIIYSLLSLYILVLFQKRSFPLQVFILLLLSIEYLIFYGTFFYSFLYFGAIGLLGYTLNRNWFIVPLYQIPFLLLTMIGSSALLEYGFLGLPICFTYTLSNFFGTVSILILLTWIGF